MIVESVEIVDNFHCWLGTLILSVGIDEMDREYRNFGKLGM